MSTTHRPDREIHDECEVRAAIAALDTADFARMRGAGRSWYGRFHLDPIRRDHKDLASEAILSTLIGARHWRKDVDFLVHIIMTMKSIASLWRKQADGEAKAGAFQERQPSLRPEHWKGDDGVPVGKKPVPDPNPEQLFHIRERLRRIDRHFADDRAVRKVIAGWRLGMTGPEIVAASGLTTKELRSAELRIRRYMRRGVKTDS